MSNSHFLFVGTAKAGTTSIFEYLRQHPEIDIPVKETFYFLRDVFTDFGLGYPAQRPKSELILDKSSFVSLYPENSAKTYGEIGTGYLYHYKKSIPLIKETFGEDVKILIILRNPVNRAYSSYMHFVKDVHEKLSFEESMKMEVLRQEQKYDFMWMHRDMGLYFKQVKAFMEAFKNVKVLITEEFKENQETEMASILEFLGVNHEVQFNTNKEYNKSGEPKFKSLQKLITQENLVKKTLRPVFRAAFNKEKRAKMRKKVKNINIASYPPMNEETRRELVEFYRTDVAALEGLLGKSLESWKI
ncbi:sulfotransferase [Cryomorphaceae bacterium 1068]|nr:sulfotransferase [Cryomorphaceae bacterium 1068]